MFGVYAFNTRPARKGFISGQQYREGADMAFEALESVVVGIKETSKATIRWIQG